MQQNFKSTLIYRIIVSICLSLISCISGYGHQKSSYQDCESVLEKTIYVNMTSEFRESTDIIEISNMSLSIPAIIYNQFLSNIYNTNLSARR